MRSTLAVLRRELRAYFVSPIPYVLMILFSLIVTYWVFERRLFFLYRQANLEALFDALPVVFTLTVPAIAMRLWSEEIRGGTIETLMTFPARTRHLVLGKFLAAWTVIAACLAATLGVLVTVAQLGDLDEGPAFAGYVGAMLLGGAFLALGQFISGKTRNQIVAFLVSLVACFVLGPVLETVGERVSGTLGELSSSLSIASRFRAIGRGVFDLRDVVYFVSIIGLFLYMNSESIENRRHR